MRKWIQPPAWITVCMCSNRDPFRRTMLQKCGRDINLMQTVIQLKGQCHEIFDFWFFFHEPVSPKHLSIPLRPFQIFSKIRGDIRGSGAPPVSTTPVQMEKIFKQKNFNNFVCAPLGSRVNIYIHFCLQVHFKVSAAWYCSNYLPPVSIAQGKLEAKLAAGVVDTGGKFAAGVVDTGAKFAAGVVDTGGNLPPVSLTLVVHLDLRISPRIFEKIRNGPNGILWGWGETDS